MFKEITWVEAKGKKVQDYTTSITGQMVIVFTDETFTTLGIDRGFERGDESIIEEAIDLLDFGHRQLIALGIITPEELKNKENIQNEEFQRQHERKEKLEYRRLKAKYK